MIAICTTITVVQKPPNRSPERAAPSLRSASCTLRFVTRRAGRMPMIRPISGMKASPKRLIGLGLLVMGIASAAFLQLSGKLTAAAAALIVLFWAGYYLTKHVW